MLVEAGFFIMLLIMFNINPSVHSIEKRNFKKLDDTKWLGSHLNNIPFQKVVPHELNRISKEKFMSKESFFSSRMQIHEWIALLMQLFD